MTHRYYYDDLYRLDSASGDFMGDAGKKARYSLSMSYDKLHNITHKQQDIVQNGIKFGGILSAGYDLTYAYAGNSQQITNIAEQTYRVERSSQSAYQTGIQSGDAANSKTQCYSYDANGNMTFVATGKLQEDSTLQATSTRQMLWDEENRLLAINDNGFVSNYWYDANGERAVKMSAENEGVFVNGVQAVGKTGNAKFTAYISPYMVVNSGGWYSKHIYMGSQRIASKLGSSGMFTDCNPLTDTTAYKKNYAPKLDSLTSGIKTRYALLGAEYQGTPSIAGLITQSLPLGAGGLYFYHSDHQGSSSVITDQLGSLVQHVEYVPFGEIFVEERASASSWQTPYLFNAKELDDETGLYYYGARYYDPRASVWLSVDPLAEKYPNVGSYVYCSNNPVIFIDPDGKEGHMFYKKDQKAEQRFALNYRNDNRIHIFSHGNKNGIEIYTNDGTVQNNVTVMNPGRFGELMEKSGSKVWGQYMEGKNETQLEVVLHGCETSELAKVLSEKYLDVYFTAPDEKNVSVNGKEKGPYKFVSIGLFKIFKGEWKTYENGKEVRSVKSDSPYPMNPLNGVEKPKDIEPYK